MVLNIFIVSLRKLLSGKFFKLKHLLRVHKHKQDLCGKSELNCAPGF